MRTLKIILIVAVLTFAGCASINTDLNKFSDDSVQNWNTALATQRHLTENFYSVWVQISPRLMGAIGHKMTIEEVDLVKQLDKIGKDSVAGKLTNFQIGETHKLIVSVFATDIVIETITRLAPWAIQYMLF